MCLLPPQAGGELGPADAGQAGGDLSRLWISGDVVRHRLSRAGDRQLNSCLHIMAITQIRHDTPGRTYYQGKRTAGKATEKPCAA